jgi:hypothetical protein
MLTIINNKINKDLPITNDEFDILLQNSDMFSNVNNNIGYLYESGIHPVEKNVNKALEYYKKGSSMKNGISMSNIAMMYMEGTHPEGKNIEKGIKLLHESCSMNTSIALYNMAAYYEIGTHPEGHNIEKAIEFYEKSVEFGDEYGIVRLGDLYRRGIYKNHEKYTELYESTPNKKDLPVPAKKLTTIYQKLDEKCNICYENLSGTFNGIHILMCGHVFHDECVKNNKCPYRCI